MLAHSFFARRALGERAHPRNHVAGAVGVLDDAADGLPRLVEIGRQISASQRRLALPLITTAASG